MQDKLQQHPNSHRYFLIFLGMTLSNAYKWNTHINLLLPKLHNKLNIIKCHSSLKFNCNTYTLLNVAKPTVIAKLEYGLFLYVQNAVMLPKAL